MPDRPTRALTSLLLVVFWTAASAASGQSAGREETEAALESITSQLNELDAWLGGAERKRAQWQREIQTSDRQVARLSREVDAAAAAVAAVENEIAGLREQQTRLDDERQSQAERIAEHLASAQRLSGGDFIKMLLNQESPEHLDRMVRYHRYFTGARLESLADYRATLAELEANAADLETSVAREQRRHTELARQQADLVARRDERQALLNRLAAETEGKEAERARLKDDRARLETLLAEIVRRSQSLDGQAFAERKGALPWPLAGRVRNAYGQPRAEGRLTWHGLQMTAEEGTPVAAVFRGRVVFADWLRGFGLLTIVDHGSGYMTLYGQADGLLKAVGDWVEGGEVIARAGRSGGASDSGLYFEVRHDGRASDPTAWLAKR